MKVCHVAGLAVTMLASLVPSRAFAVKTSISINTVDPGTGTVFPAESSQAVVAGKPAIAYYDSVRRNLNFARNSDPNGAGSWIVSTVDSLGEVGRYPSLAVIDGCPAISYIDSTIPGNSQLKFARNSAPDGSGAWTTATIAAAAAFGIQTSLALVGGKPAIAYASEQLRLARNSAADGSGTWTIITLDSSGSPVSSPSLSVLTGAGNPAISYGDNANGLRFVRALDSAGTTWSAPVTVDSAKSFGAYTSLISLSAGTPAISYYDQANAELKFARNSVADGSGPWTVTTVSSTGAIGRYSSMALTSVVGNQTPIIAYYDETNGDLKVARNSATDGSGTWTIVPADSSAIDDVGSLCSLAIVNGTPAISYFSSAGELRHTRNSAPDASAAWTATTVQSGFLHGDTGKLNSQAIIGGNPAITYLDAFRRKVMFARNSAADGSGVWSIHTVTDFRANFPPENIIFSLAEVAGNPAVCFYDADEAKVKFARAPSADGSGTWFVNTLSQGVGSLASTSTPLVVVNGNPATAFYLPGQTTDGGLCYARAPGADGSGAWTIIPLRLPTVGRVDFSVSLAVVNGNPAIACNALGLTPGIEFMRSEQSDGLGVWTTTLIEAIPDSGLSPSLSIIAGRPAVSYHDLTKKDLKFARAASGDGDGPWSVITVDSSGDTGRSPSLSLLGGAPTISYRDQSAGTLRCAVNNAVDGTGKWSLLTVDGDMPTGRWVSSLILPNGKLAVSYYSAESMELKWATFSFLDLAIERPDGVEIADGGSQSITAAVGFARDLSFLLRNYGNDPLTGLTVTKDGPSAADFSIMVNPAGPVVGPFAGTPLIVRFNPATTGTKTATIHITSNDLGESPYDINLTGAAVSFAQDTDGDGLNDGSEVQLSALGFDWQAAQSELVAMLSSNLVNTGLVQGLNIGTPVISRDAESGQFKLTIGLQKSADLKTFTPFPFTSPNTTINPQGQIEFVFSVPDSAAFFRLQTH
jgi:hypothetical protein